MSDAAYTFGWRGFRMEVPEAWEPGKFEGDDLKGYLRLDDRRMPRVELKWDRVYRDTAADDAFDLYRKELDRAAKQKKKGRFRRDPREFRLLQTWPKGVKARTLRWSGEVECVAAFIACAECNRLSALQFLFPEGELRMGLVREAVRSFRDHPEDLDGPALWGLYRMRMHVPARWRLKSHKFGPGFAQLQFTGPAGLAADIRRAGPAEVLLTKTSIEDWALGRLPKGVKIDRANLERAEVRGDAVVTAAREPRGAMAAIRRRSKSDVRLRGMAMEMAAWHCPASNRLWSVAVYAPTLDAVREAEWRVFCH